MTEVAVLLLGWFLGLLSPQIVEGIARRYRRPEFMRSLALELDELRFKLVLVRFDIRWTQGRLDRAFVRWAADRARGYSGVVSNHPSRKHVIEFGDYTDEQVATLNALPEDPRRTKSIQRYSLPLLSSRLQELSILALPVQRRLLEVLARLDFFNSAADKLHENLNRTFEPGISRENWNVIQVNNQVWLSSADTSAEQMVDQIDALMPMLGSQSNNALQRTGSAVTPLAEKAQASRQAAGR